MVLMHDIRPATALALPKLLRELKGRGYRIVHVVPASCYRPKTATLPSQWRVRTASHYLPRSMRRAGGDFIARGGGFWPRAAASPSPDPQQRQAAGRHRAQVTVIMEENEPEAVAAFRRPRSPFSALFDLPRQMLQ